MPSCVQINAPDWYAREDFMTWLRGEQYGQFGPPASWHPRDRAVATECSDAFVTIELGSPLLNFGEGSDSDMPPDVWDELCQVVEKAGMEEGLVWITNLIDWVRPKR